MSQLAIGVRSGFRTFYLKITLVKPKFKKMWLSIFLSNEKFVDFLCNFWKEKKKTSSSGFQEFLGSIQVELESIQDTFILFFCRSEACFPGATLPCPILSLPRKTNGSNSSRARQKRISSRSSLIQLISHKNNRRDSTRRLLATKTMSPVTSECRKKNHKDILAFTWKSTKEYRFKI